MIDTYLTPFLTGSVDTTSSDDWDAFCKKTKVALENAREAWQFRFPADDSQGTSTDTGVDTSGLNSSSNSNSALDTTSNCSTGMLERMFEPG